MSSNRNDSWPSFKSSTAPFLELYEEVTVRLNRFKALRNADEKRWIEYLIQGFQEQYLDWEFNPIVRDYLERVDAAASGEQALQVIGHAYLHIAFDLPRKLADSLVAFSIPDRKRARTLFQDMSLIFEDAFKQVLLKPGRFGKLGRIGRFLNRLMPRQINALISAASKFALSLRSGAWIIAENLADGNHRGYLEECLWKEVEAKSRLVMALSSDPIEWMANLPSPSPPLDGAPYSENERQPDSRLKKSGQDDLR